MRSTLAKLLLIAIIASPAVFAEVTTTIVQTASDDPCKAIATACLSGGFTNEDVVGKAFWNDCMKPILLGQVVSGISIDPKSVSACRDMKIVKMQSELKELQQAVPIMPVVPVEEAAPAAQ